MSNLLITGALGHIGSKFIHNLKPGEFDEVRMIDNLLTQRYVSLFNLPEGINFRFFEDDICTADLDNYFKDVDTVIHLAAITDATTSFEKEDEVKSVNYQGTKRMAESCIRHDCRLLFPSTTSVYGVQSGVVDEDSSREDLKPQSPYADSKLKAEDVVQELGKNGELKFTICRFGTIFGTSIGMRFHTAVNKFCWQAAMKQPITVWRSAMNQKRPYLDLQDCLEAIRFIIQEDLFDRNLYNVVTTNTTVREIVKIISSYISDVSVEFVDKKIMNQLSYAVSSDRFKSKGFVFQGNLKQSIGETIQLLKAVSIEQKS